MPLTGEVPEENEGNNSFEKTFLWSGGPDLVIKSITLDPAKPDVESGTLTATIENVGKVGTGALVNINITMYLDGVECDTGLLIGGLGAGNTATESTSSCNPTTPGEHTIRFEVDTYSDVAEQDEANNSFEKTFVWGGPDLVVTGLTLEPSRKPCITLGSSTGSQPLGVAKRVPSWRDRSSGFSAR